MPAGGLTGGLEAPHAAAKVTHKSVESSRGVTTLTVGLTTAHQPRRVGAPHDATTPDRRRLHALVSAQGEAAEP